MKTRLLCIQMFEDKTLEYCLTDDNGVPLPLPVQIVPFTVENTLSQWQALCKADAQKRFAGAHEPITLTHK